MKFHRFSIVVQIFNVSFYLFFFSKRALITLFFICYMVQSDTLKVINQVQKTDFLVIDYIISISYLGLCGKDNCP